jgi:hypothetical protein
MDLLISTLAAAGVAVSVQGDCPVGALGYYTPSANHVVLCGGSYIDSTLRHEAIHAAQDCRAGQSNSTLSVLQPSLNPFITSGRMDETATWITTAYPASRWAAEWEAFTLERISNHEVAGIVNEWCQ